MKLSIFCPFGLKTPIHASKIGVLVGISPLKWGAVSTKPPKGTSAGCNGSRGVLLCVYLRGNKKCDEEKEKEERRITTHFGRFGITVKWPRIGCRPMQLF